MNSNSMVIDASVIVKWVSENEKNYIEASLLMKKHLENEEKITIPDFCYYEVANSLVVRKEATESLIEKTLEAIFELELQIDHPSTEDMIEAAKLAFKHKTTIYDMIYAVVAKKHKTVLITADEKFMAKTKFPYVKLLSEYYSDGR